MSLALLQGYSSAEEDEDEKETSLSSSSFSNNGKQSEEEDKDEVKTSLPRRNLSKRDHNPLPNSILPSALDVFAEVAGPPEFLNNSVGNGELGDEVREVHRRGRNKSRREKKDLPVGVVVEAKAQLVGIRDRVRSDVEGSCPTPATNNTTSGEGKRVVSASNPEAKDAAELLRMCLQCAVPKTYSHTRGMVCPVCGDRPLADPLKESEKKKGSTIKDKEKSKRMKGQSSHSAWKSETEMQLRQQYD